MCRNLAQKRCEFGLNFIRNLVLNTRDFLAKTSAILVLNCLRFCRETALDFIGFWLDFGVKNGILPKNVSFCVKR